MVKKLKVPAIAAFAPKWRLKRKSELKPSGLERKLPPSKELDSLFVDSSHLYVEPVEIL